MFSLTAAFGPGRVELVPVGLPLHVVVGLVQESDQALDLVPGIPARLDDGAEDLSGDASSLISSQSRPAIGVSADVFVGGVLCTLSARSIGGLFGPVRAGTKVSAFVRPVFLISVRHEEVNCF
jgi:hypothetical protein